MKKGVFFVFVIAVGAAVIFKGDLEKFIYKQRHQGLINYDHGILSVEDLNQSDKGSFAATPFDGARIGYPYWQCFNKKYLKMKCSYNEPLDKQGSSLTIEIQTESESHTYGLNHAISGESCDGLVVEINRVMSEQDYFCINGIDGVLDRVAEKREYSWSFYRIKTKNGYASF